MAELLWTTTGIETPTVVATHVLGSEYLSGVLQYSGASSADAFTVSTTCSVESVSLFARRFASGSASIGSLSVIIYADALEGSVVCSGSISRLSVGTSDYAWTSIPMSASGELNTGTTYYIHVQDDIGVFDSFGDRDDIRIGEGNAQVGHLWRETSISGGWFDAISTRLFARGYGTPVAGLSKPTTPSPVHASGPGVDFSAFTFGWANGGGATSYRVRIGSQSEAVNLFATVETESFTAAPASAARAFILGVQDVIYWRIDALDDEENVVEGDVWSFDPRPAKVDTPTPEDSATDQNRSQTLSWEAGSANTDTYDLFYGATELFGLEDAQYALPVLGYDADFTWRVDATNEFGTTTGDTWSFTTLLLTPPQSSYTLLPGGGGSGPFDDPPGTEGTDWVWNGINNMQTTRRLVAAAMNRLWYEEA